MAPETAQNLGVVWTCPAVWAGTDKMMWRMVAELIGADWTVVVREVCGGAAGEYSPRMIGLTLEEGKRMLAGLQRHLVQAQTEESASGDAVSDAGRYGPSKTHAPGAWCRCSAR